MIVKLLSYNIRFGGRKREALLAAVIRDADPDLVVFQEAIDPEVIKRLSISTNMPYWAARPEHSIGYISRLAIEHHEWHYPAGAKHSFLEIVIAGCEARVFGLHLSSMFSKWAERQRVREINALLKSIARHQEGVHVLVGDFNTLAVGETLDVRRMPAWIRGMVWLSGRDIQRETIRVMTDANYVDGYRWLHPSIKGYTFPVWDPHLRLDYVFIRREHASRLLACEVLATNGAVVKASDHFPILAQIECSQPATAGK